MFNKNIYKYLYIYSLYLKHQLTSQTNMEANFLLKSKIRCGSWGPSRQIQRHQSVTKKEDLITIKERVDVNQDRPSLIIEPPPPPPPRPSNSQDVMKNI